MGLSIPSVARFILPRGDLCQAPPTLGRSLPLAPNRPNCQCPHFLHARPELRRRFTSFFPRLIRLRPALPLAALLFHPREPLLVLFLPHAFSSTDRSPISRVSF
jgi:hypothetical protein